MLSSSWSPTKFNLSILFVCCSCILAACLTRSGVSAQDKGDESEFGSKNAKLPIFNMVDLLFNNCTISWSQIAVLTMKSGYRT